MNELMMIMMSWICVAETVNRHQIENGGNVLDDDFQVIKNYILLEEETREVWAQESKCPDYRLFNEEWATTFELVGNCNEWEAVRVTVENRGEPALDYYINHEYRKINTESSGTALITSSFGIQTDTASVRHFHSVLTAIKATLLSKRYTENLLNFINQRLSAQHIIKTITSSTRNAVVTQSSIEIIPSDNVVSPYSVSLTPEAPNKGGVNWNIATRPLQPETESRFFAHLTKLYLDARMDRIKQIR